MPQLHMNSEGFLFSYAVCQIVPVLKSVSFFFFFFFYFGQRHLLINMRVFGKKLQFIFRIDLTWEATFGIECDF